jgi:hypothetical protein
MILNKFVFIVPSSEYVMTSEGVERTLREWNWVPKMKEMQRTAYRDTNTLHSCLR